METEYEGLVNNFKYILKEAFLNEISILSQMKHRNFVQLQDVFFGERSFYVVMELVEGDVLGDMMRKHFPFNFGQI
jgi:serine/threonine protein kinase